MRMKSRVTCSVSSRGCAHFSRPSRGVCGLAPLKDSPPCPVSSGTKALSFPVSHQPFIAGFLWAGWTEQSEFEREAPRNCSLLLFLHLIYCGGVLRPWLPTKSQVSSRSSFLLPLGWCGQLSWARKSRRRELTSEINSRVLQKEHSAVHSLNARQNLAVCSSSALMTFGAGSFSVVGTVLCAVGC